MNSNTNSSSVLFFKTLALARFPLTRNDTVCISPNLKRSIFLSDSKFGDSAVFFYWVSLVALASNILSEGLQRKTLLNCNAKCFGIMNSRIYVYFTLLALLQVGVYGEACGDVAEGCPEGKICATYTNTDDEVSQHCVDNPCYDDCHPNDCVLYTKPCSEGSDQMCLVPKCKITCKNALCPGNMLCYEASEEPSCKPNPDYENPMCPKYVVCKKPKQCAKQLGGKAEEWDCIDKKNYKEENCHLDQDCHVYACDTSCDEPKKKERGHCVRKVPSPE
mmetsp:Transcript_17090/g.20704  ORF Transcript_17090/g.20704 Transcript_17090/m.20704 type:complete len:276 (-) Transcript_17090:1307-2134(-)